MSGGRLLFRVDSMVVIAFQNHYLHCVYVLQRTAAQDRQQKKVNIKERTAVRLSKISQGRHSLVSLVVCIRSAGWRDDYPIFSGLVFGPARMLAVSFISQLL